MPRTSPLPMELNPQVVFERLFGSGSTPEVRAAAHEAEPQHPRLARRANSASLRKQLGAGDVRTVNQYTDEIREIERRIQLAAKASSEVPDLDLPPGIPEQFDEHISLHCELVAMAFKADITRVVTLLGARDLTGRVYQFPKSQLFPEGGTSVSFHGGSHHQDDPVQIRRYADAEPLSRLDDGVSGGGAEGDSGRRRHAAGPLADHVRHEHGQFESAPALRRAAHLSSAARTVS